jgi:hypothetical protein
MDTQKSQFNRMLLIVLAALYVLTILAFSYANWAADPDFTQWWMILLNILILSIPLVILYGSLYILIAAWREFRASGRVDPRLAKIIHWAPRAAAILFIFFISLFSLDVFEMEGTLLEKLGGFLIHNIPSFGLLALLIIAWKRPAVGFVAFFAAAIFFAVFFIRDIQALPSLLLLVAPILLVAFLFYADWKWLLPRPPVESGPAA